MEKLNIYHLSQQQRDLLVTALRVNMGLDHYSPKDNLLMSNLTESLTICRDIALIIPENSVFNHIMNSDIKANTEP